MNRAIALIAFGLLTVTGAVTDASAQPMASKPARVAWVSVTAVAQVASYFEAFRNGLAAEGYVEGRNLEIIVRSANGTPDRLSMVVDEVVSLKPDVIVSQGPAIFGFRKVTDIPVVYGFSGDAIAAELTDSLARPSRNLTGITFMSLELNGKRLDLLRAATPDAKKVVLMGDPVHPGADLEVAASQDMARQLGMEIRWAPTRNPQEVHELLATLEKEPPDALVVLPDSIMLESREQVAEFAIRHGIPAISGWSMFAQSGGLLTYGPRLTESFRRLAYYTARILKGSKPSELPVERPTTFELVINLNTAKQIGLTVPPSLLGLADEVIE